MRDALLAAACFGTAATLLAMGLALMFDVGLVGVGALGAIPAASVVAALWSPQLVADAESPYRRGVKNGVLITCAAYALGAAFVMTWIPVDGGMRTRVQFFGLALMASILLVPLALPFGMTAGWIFDAYVRSTLNPQPDSGTVREATIPRPVKLKPTRRLFASSSPTWRRRSRRDPSAG